MNFCLKRIAHRGKDRTKGCDELLAIGKAIIWVLGNTFEDDLFKFLTDRDTKLPKRGRLHKQMSSHQLKGRDIFFIRPLEWGVAAKRFVECDAYTVDVTAWIEVLSALHLLGGEVCGGTDHESCLCQSLVLCGAGESKVRKFDLVFFGDQDVRGFDVSVDNADLVGICKPT